MEAPKNQSADDLRALLALAEGQRFLHRLLLATGPLASGYEAEPNATAFKQGVRWVGLWLLREILEANPGQAAALLADYVQTKGVLS